MILRCFYFVCVTALLVTSITKMEDLASALADLDKIPELLLSIEHQSSVVKPMNEEIKTDIDKLFSLSKGWEEVARLSIERQCTEIERHIEAKTLGSIYETPKEFHFIRAFGEYYPALCCGKNDDLFQKAIEFRNTVEAEFFLLSDKLNPDRNYRSNFRAIEIAVFNHNPSMVSLLLRDSRIVTLDSAFFYSVDLDDHEIFKLFLEDGRCDPTSSNRFSLLISSIEKGYSSLFELFLQDKRINLSSPVELVLGTQPIGRVALTIAIRHGRKEIVRRLLQEEFDIHIPNYRPGILFETPLSLACSLGHLEIVKLLLQDKRIDPSENDNWSIDTARYLKQRDIVKLLLHDPRVSSSGSALAKKNYLGAKQYVEAS